MAEQKLTRAEILAKARAAKSAKTKPLDVPVPPLNLSSLSEEKAKPGPGSESFVDLGPVPKYSYQEMEVWMRALLCVMGNYSTKTASAVDACVPVADKVLEVFNKKRNETV